MRDIVTRNSNSVRCLNNSNKFFVRQFKLPIHNIVMHDSNSVRRTTKVHCTKPNKFSIRQFNLPIHNIVMRDSNSVRRTTKVRCTKPNKFSVRKFNLPMRNIVTRDSTSASRKNKRNKLFTDQFNLSMRNIVRCIRCINKRIRWVGDIVLSGCIMQRPLGAPATLRNRRRHSSKRRLAPFIRVGGFVWFV